MEREKDASTQVGWGESPCFLHGLQWHHGREEVPVPCASFFRASQARGLEHLVLVGQGWTFRLLTGQLLVVFGCNRGHFPKVLSSCLSQEIQLIGAYFGVPVGILGLQTSLASSMRCMRQTENPGNLSFDSWLLSTFHYLLTFYTQWSEILVLCIRRNRIKYIYYIFLEAEF